jgi:hypothetical protein
MDRITNLDVYVDQFFKRSGFGQKWTGPDPQRLFGSSFLKGLDLIKNGPDPQRLCGSSFLKGLDLVKKNGPDPQRFF